MGSVRIFMYYGDKYGFCVLGCHASTPLMRLAAERFSSCCIRNYQIDGVLAANMAVCGIIRDYSEDE